MLVLVLTKLVVPVSFGTCTIIPYVKRAGLLQSDKDIKERLNTEMTQQVHEQMPGKKEC